MSFFKPLGSVAEAVLEGVAGIIGNGGDPLRTPPSDGTVTLPSDLFAKSDVQTEWWYYTGHCVTERGREFGFELVFFKRRTDLDKVGIFPVMTIANPMYFAHFAITDVTGKGFRYAHIRSFNGPLDLPVSMSTTSCDVKLGDWSLREVAGKHLLHATMEDGLVFDAILEPAKPLVLNGDNGNGIARKGAGASNHFSYTRMNVTGQFNTVGAVETFEGKAWMDREFGIWGHGDWDWFSIQFDDNTELMIYQFRTGSGSKNGESTGTFVDADGTCRYLVRKDFIIEELETWTSPHTGAVYPSLWKVRVPSLDIEIDIRPLVPDQELVTRGTTMITYWEGACEVTGGRAGSPVGGRAYVELVGYDRSHENVGVTDLLFGPAIEKLKSVI